MEAMGGKQKNYIYYALCTLACAVALFPIGYDYILSGGMVTQWLVRVAELAVGLQEGHLNLYPSVEAIVSSGVKYNGLNSNLWFILPGILYWLGENLVAAYHVFMALVQVGTLLASMLFFGRVFAGSEGRIPEMFGVLLYMTCPYRIYICYDFSNLSQAVALALLPLYLWAVAGLVGEGGKCARDAAVAALALAGIGYADSVFFVVLAGMTLLAGLVRRKIWIFAALGAGCVFFGPGLSRLLQYLFMDGFGEYGMPLKSIMPGGYRVGEYFGSYAFRDGHPGMGLGMLVCILAGICMWFVEGRGENHVSGKIFAGLAGFCTLLSLRYFPWDLVERLGVWALKFVSLMDTPAFFWGMGFLCLCVPAAASADRVGRHKEKKAAAVAVLVTAALFCVGVCVYQCNMLMYDRPPVALR